MRDSTEREVVARGGGEVVKVWGRAGDAVGRCLSAEEPSGLLS